MQCCTGGVRRGGEGGRLEMQRPNAKMLEGDANDDIEVNFGYVSVHRCFALFAVQMKEFLGGRPLTFFCTTK